MSRKRGATQTAAAAAAVPLTEDEHVKALMAVLLARQTDTKALTAILNSVGQMEARLHTAADELNAMRRELDEMREQQSHPLRTSAQKAIKTAESNLADTREKLAGLRQRVVEGCKNALAAFREKGAEALAGLASFFNLRDGLESLRENMNKNIRSDDKSIAKVAAVSAEYHEVGRHVKNLGRTLVGKEANAEAKPLGSLAKMVQAPYKLDRAVSGGILRGVERALGGLERLEQRPSVLESLQEKKAQAPRQEAPAADKARKQEAAL